MRDTLVCTVMAQMEVDESIVFLTGDLGFGVLDQLQAQHSTRFINAGASEQNMMAMAAGLALEGFRPFVYSIANFPTLRALEQLRNDVCYHRLPVRIVSVGGGIGYGSLGSSHHASDDLGALCALPGLAVFTPSTRREVVDLTNAACSWDGPVYLRVDRGDPASAGAEDTPTVPGRMNTARGGSHATVIAYGNVVTEVAVAADLLAADGINVNVTTAVSLRPFDRDRVVAVASAGPLVVVEEHGRIGGLASLVAQTCLEEGVAPVGFLALNLGDDFVRDVGSTAWLRERKGLDAAGVASQVRALLQRSDARRASRD